MRELCIKGQKGNFQDFEKNFISILETKDSLDRQLLPFLADLYLPYVVKVGDVDKITFATWHLYRIRVGSQELKNMMLNIGCPMPNSILTLACYVQNSISFIKK